MLRCGGGGGTWLVASHREEIPVASWLARRWGGVQRADLKGATPHLFPSTPAVLAQRRASSRPTSRSARTAPPRASSAAGAAPPAASSAAAAGASWGLGIGVRGQGACLRELVPSAMAGRLTWPLPQGRLGGAFAAGELSRSRHCYWTLALRLRRLTLIYL